jgi:hypothetical protein
MQSCTSSRTWPCRSTTASTGRRSSTSLSTWSCRSSGIAIAIPVYYLCKPPQPQPFDWFPYAALGIVVVSVIYSIVLNQRDPTLGDRVGSIVADE